jgi:ATP-binding cassette subfamily E protein 1
MFVEFVQTAIPRLEVLLYNMFDINDCILYRLPIPRPGEVLGLVGTNGIGKSTALKILAGKQKPNLGRFDVRIWCPHILLL